MSEDELLARVTAEVHDRINEYKQHEPEMSEFAALFGYTLYGDISDPIETQIQTGCKYYKVKKIKLEQIRKQHESHKIYQDTIE